MSGKHIEHLFGDGTPLGLATDEIFNWTDPILSTPRSEMPRSFGDLGGPAPA